MKPVFVVGGLYSLANGVAWIMRDLAAALGRAGAPVTVCAADCWGRGARSIGDIFDPPTTWVSAKGLWLGGLSWSPRLHSRMREVVSRADVVHNHSVWMLPNSYGSRIAAQHDKPTVITAHGALEPWALENSGWKKRLVGRAFQNRDLMSADCIHVNSEAEIAGIRRFGITCPIAVIPNGVHLPDYDKGLPKEVFIASYPELQGKRLALFLARLNEKKGLGHLIPAWANVVRDHGDWHLVIAGPDSGYERRARELAQEAGVGDHITFTGPVHGELKKSALDVADLFVQPSFSEGFSMSIIEAMACRLPVLLTPGCNFAEVAETRAGICVQPTIDDTEMALRQFMEMSEAERTAMGERGRTLIESQYTWDSIAQKTASLYRWLTTGGSAPSFVQLH